MILKPTKGIILNFFMYYGWMFILFSIVISSTIAVSISSIYQIKDYQRFTIFIAANKLKEERYKDELLSYLKDDGVLQVRYYDYKYSDSSLLTRYETYGKTSDINILSYTDLVDMKEAIQNSFLELNNDLISDLEINNNYQYYQYDNHSYAIKIYDKDDESYNSHFKYEEWINFPHYDYYLLITSRSKNFGPYSYINKTSFGIKGLRYLLNENTK